MTIDVNGVTLFYEVFGSGDPLILVHGNGEDHTIFTEAARVLQEYFTCYLVDSRGHGQSTQLRPLHYRDMAEDYRAFMEALGLKNVTYFGFSDGGILGLLLGKEAGLLDTLIVSGANMRPDAVSRKIRLSMQLMHFVTRNDKLRLMIREPDITPEELGSIRAKTFVLAGEKDVILPEHTEEIARSIPGAVKRILAGESHGSHIIHSTKIADIILELTGRTAKI